MELWQELSLPAVFGCMTLWNAKNYSASCQVSCASWQGERIVYIASKYGHCPAIWTNKPACTDLPDVDTNTELETAARSVRDEMRGCTGTSG
jgi:hypothetical protein